MPDQRLSYLIGRVDRILRVQMEEALGSVGLTVNELTALSVLARQSGLSNARLARRSLVTPQAMHKVVSALEGRGLVTRPGAGVDGRSREIAITREGQALLDEVNPLLDDIESALTSDLAPRDREVLEASLRRIARL